MHWAIYALIAAWFQASFVEVNRQVKAEPQHLNLWHGLCGLVVTLFFIPWMVFPSAPLFYASFIIIGAIITTGCIIQMHLSAQRNGRVASMWMPISTLSGFIIWLVLDSALREKYQSNLFQTLGIIASFGLCGYALNSIRRSDIALKTLLIVAPVGILYGFNRVLIKYITPEDPPIGYFFTYTMLYFLSITIFQIIVMTYSKKLDRSLFQTKVIKGGLFVALCSVMTSFCLVVALASAENPGYIGAVMMTVPVWIMLYHKARNVHDDADPYAGGLLIAGALLLTLVTA